MHISHKIFMEDIIVGIIMFCIILPLLLLAYSAYKERNKNAKV